jgi:RNA polymerase sigma-70 factor (ECF subfamily)
MLRVFRGIERYRERGSFRAWVYRIAANLAVSHLRRARWITVESPAILERTPDERAPNAQARLERAEAERELRAGLAALSVEHRTVLLLRVGEGMSLSEVAEVLCVAEGTVKSRLHYAVARMRAHAARVRSAAAEGRRA